MGLLSSNITLDVKDTTDNGIVVLQPSGSDTSVATINRLNAGSTRIKARQKIGYVTVDASNTLKLGNADLNIGADGFIAMLVRIKMPESLFNSYAKIATTTQTIAAGSDAGQPKLMLGIAGRRGGTPSTGTRGRFFIWSELNSGARNVASDGGTVLKIYGSTVDEGQYFWGDYNRPTLNCFQADWMWVYCHRSTVAKNPGANFMNRTSVSFTYANSMVAGLSPVRDSGLIKGNGNIGGPAATLTVGALSANGITTFTNIDFVLGGSTSLDIARIIKCNSSLDYQSITGLFAGKSFEDVNITPTSDDFIINLSSLSEAGSKVTVNTGSPTWNSAASDGPIMEIDAGVVTTTLNKTITSGKVIL